ncbi:MAG: hypothetical protein KY394_03130 [Actinobacteria bacterium]|nr:hypothetical protein [Actinomycetota bacterium]
MPPDLASIADPRFVLLAWAAGLALAAGAITQARVVGPGFTWLAAGSAALVGLAGVFTPGAIWARSAIILLVLGLIWGRNHVVAGPLLVLAGIGFLVEAGIFGGWVPAVSAAVALGGVNGEMLLGHWYLIDPRLPRWALRGLAIAGIIGLLADGAVLSALGGFPGGGPTAAFWALLIASVVLMAAVVAALRYPAYSGVMAATGLSYLAVLTTLGAIFLGRALVAGLGPFAS